MQAVNATEAVNAYGLLAFVSDDCIGKPIMLPPASYD